MLVLDRNLRVVTREGADDLLNLEVEVCRAVWITALQRLLKEIKSEEDEDIPPAK